MALDPLLPLVTIRLSGLQVTRSLRTTTSMRAVTCRSLLTLRVVRTMAPLVVDYRCTELRS